MCEEKKPCFVCQSPMSEIGRWKLRAWLEDCLYIDVAACWPCWSRVSMSGQVQLERGGNNYTVRIAPRPGAPAGKV